MVTPAKFTEDTVEQATLEWLTELGYTVLYGPDIAPESTAPERENFQQVVLEERLRSAIEKLNPTVPADAHEEAFKQVMRLVSPSLIQNNRNFHRLLRDGVTVQVRGNDGAEKNPLLKLADFDNPDNNDWLAVNQFTIIGNSERRPDVIIFVNGLPLAVIELKNQADENATVEGAHNQLQTYKNDIPDLFHYNEIMVISDGAGARVGSLTAGIEWFKPWLTIDDDKPIKNLPELEVLLRGVFDRKRFLGIVSNFSLFEQDTDSDDVYKILSGYHQYHAAQSALISTVRASSDDGDRRGGVVWHTQGSGKSFTMLFFSGLLISSPEMNNPTLVILTDRNDLDDQLFGQFQRCSDILRQQPVQAETVENLRDLLQVASGGVIFTTVHKFAEAEGQFPLLTDRKNVVVIADEAHRSQYGFYARQVPLKKGDAKAAGSADLGGGNAAQVSEAPVGGFYPSTDTSPQEFRIAYGFARNIRDGLPNATFVGFTGTPVEQSDKNTRAVFGDYVSVYDIQRAVDDGATVPIYYESRVIKMRLEKKAVDSIDDEFEAITEAEESTAREKLKSKWAALEAMVGDPERLEVLAADLLDHFEKRQQAMLGKGMIVCMSRQICVDLYNALIKLKPEWHSEEDEQGTLKIIMTGSASDPQDWQQHARNKTRRKAMASHFKDAGSDFKLVIVRDMWLTGFDAPCLHTMYIDKPMQGHGLMQAIARVNRVFEAKPGGLVVDYLGIGDTLQKALKTYTASGGTGQATHDPAEAIRALQLHYEQCCDMLHGQGWEEWLSDSPTAQLQLTIRLREHILEQEDGKERWLAHVDKLTQSNALCPTADYAMSIRDDIALFQIIRTMFRKYNRSGNTADQTDLALRQLVSKAVMTTDDGVIDIYQAAGMEKPDISILSEEFLREVRMLPHKNVAAELLAKLLSDEIKIRKKSNVVQGKTFSDMLQTTLNKYHNRAITTIEILEELQRLAKDMREAELRGERLGLGAEEANFYDALANHEDVESAMGEDKLKVIATELVQTVRTNVSIDWHVRDQARANIRRLVKRALRKYGYPPDLQDAAVKLVLQQAEAMAGMWAK